MKLTATQLQEIIDEEIERSVQARRADALLRRVIREMVLAEADVTVGDVKDALEALGKAKTIEKAKAGIKSLGLFAVGKVLNAMQEMPSPTLQSIGQAGELGMGLFDFVMAVKGTEPEAKKSNPVLNALTIDPETSAIVDDEVEARFVKELASTIAGMAPSTKLPDADKALANWLKGKFGGAHVTK